MPENGAMTPDAPTYHNLSFVGDRIACSCGREFHHPRPRIAMLNAESHVQAGNDLDSAEQKRRDYSRKWRKAEDAALRRLQGLHREEFDHLMAEEKVRQGLKARRLPKRQPVPAPEPAPEPAVTPPPMLSPEELEEPVLVPAPDLPPVVEDDPDPMAPPVRRIA